MINTNELQVKQADQRPITPGRVRLLMIVEGINDIEFLRRISLALHRSDGNLPNLAEMEIRGELVFIPFGGGHVRAWAQRFAPLSLPEFHLYDHELPPETDLRRDAANIVNGRDRCRAVLTRMRSVENYLHPDAIRSAGGIDISFEDFDCVSELAARLLYAHRPGEIPWQLLPRRSRSRMTNRAKRWLNTAVADRMNAALLDESDPKGEVRSWMTSISDLLNS
ncbi:ATP-dependent endonuclease [Roseiconus lacunae]|uniref:ATP-dependent endonuclease n=1 Tax=Roseiconus lacunae TaxID=2605694 RepID=A0ABT7PF56_9BACT|nr:ATP-dependent endonuclease [Roseiconus lacunae]MDM4015134.1 ATP-dependent endonuclease [Roseiconus lacunae]